MLNKKIKKTAILLPLITVLSLSGISCDTDSMAQEFPECFTGTYLNTEGSGTKSLFTFTSEGNFIGTSSTQKLLNFSTEQGSWKSTGADSARAVFLDFTFGENDELENIARVDLEISFFGLNCEETEGSFEIRFFEEGEDPLDISTDTGEAISDTFTGRKIAVE